MTSHKQDPAGTLPTLIGISGKQYAGKDLLTSLLIERFPQYTQMPIASGIKQLYAQQHGLTLAQLEQHKAQHRPGLIALGNWGRAQDPMYWLKQILVQPGPKIVSDVRLIREYELLRAAGAFLIRIEADRAVRAERGNIVSERDPTECELDTITTWDAVLANNSTCEALIQQINLLPFNPASSALG